MSTLLQNGTVVSAHGCQKADLLLHKGRIEAIGQPKAFHAPDARRIDATGLVVMPGIIDSHIHGCAGVEFDGFQPITPAARLLARRGVTSFLPTVSPAQGMDYIATMEGFKTMSLPQGCARMIGVHLEGPFVNVQRRGAIPAGAILPVDLVLLRRILDAGEGLVKIVTLAPELPHADEAIGLLRSRDVAVSMGHSIAPWAVAQRATAAGASRATHTYNAMMPLHHREAGLLGATMLEDDVYAELITDLAHVCAQAAAILLRVKGTKRVVAVSDCLRHGAQPLPDGAVVQDGVVRDGCVYEPDGTLCGSLRPLTDHMPAFAAALGLDAAAMADLFSANCARNLGLAAGEIAVGRPADLVLADGQMNVKMTILGGNALP